MKIKYVYVYGHRFFNACSQNAKSDYWLPDVCLVSLFVCRSAWNNSAPTESTFMKFEI